MGAYIDGSRVSLNCSFPQISKWDSLTKFYHFICKTFSIVTKHSLISFISLGRRRGLVVRAVDYGVGDPRFESRRDPFSQKNKWKMEKPQIISYFRIERWCRGYRVVPNRFEIGKQKGSQGRMDVKQETRPVEDTFIECYPSSCS